MTAPDKIWMIAPQTAEEFGLRISDPEAGPAPPLPRLEYVRRDPTVIAALPEVQAPIAAKLEEALESLAALEHEQWAHWTAYMLDNRTSKNMARWRKQVLTDYADLSNAAKESDRQWARKVISALITPDMAQALAARDARVRREALDSVTTLHHVLSMVREKSGLGAGPMLSDLPDAVAEKMEAARREERERAAGIAENFEWFECGAAFWPAAIAAAIRAEGGK